MVVKLSDQRLADFSVREAQLLRLAHGGYTNSAIAALLGISEATVNTYWNRIRSKVGHRSRTEILLSLREKSSDALPARRVNALFGVAYLTLERRFMWVNPHWVRIFGGVESDWVGKPVSALEALVGVEIPFQNGHNHLADVHDHANTVEGLLKSSMCNDSAVQITCSFVRLQSRQAGGFMISAEPRNSAGIENAIVDQGDVIASFGVFILDTEGHVRACDAAAQTMIGSRFADIEDRVLWQFATSPAKNSAVHSAFQMAVDGGKSVGVKADVESPIGEPVAAQWWFSPLIGHSSTRRLVSCVVRLEELVPARNGDSADCDELVF